MKKIKLFLADTLALYELYSSDSREFPFSAPDFASTPQDIDDIRRQGINFVQEFSQITDKSKFNDGFILLRQLVHSLERLKPLEATLTSWQHTFITVQTLYFTLLVVLTVTTDMAIFVKQTGESDELQGGYSRDSLMQEIFSESKKVTQPNLFDDLKSIKFGNESILQYTARAVSPLETAFGTLTHLVTSGSSKKIGLNTQTSLSIGEIPAGSTFLHTLSRRFLNEAPSNRTLANSLQTLRSYGASPRILDTEGQSVLSILSGSSLKGGSDSTLLQETLIALEGGSTESQRGRAAYIRQKYSTFKNKKSNIARLWLNTVVHDKVTVPFSHILYMDDSWVYENGAEFIYSGDTDNHYYKSEKEFKADFPQAEGVPYILLEDLLNEDSYRYPRGMFRSLVKGSWDGPRGEGEILYEAASSAGFESLQGTFGAYGETSGPALGSAGSVVGSAAGYGGSVGGSAGYGGSSGSAGGSAGYGGSLGSAGGSAGGSAQYASAAQASSQATNLSERDIIMASVEANRIKRLQREALEAQEQAQLAQEQAQLEAAAAEAEKAVKKEQRNLRKVAKDAGLGDNIDKLVRVEGGYRPIDRHVLIKVSGLTYRYDNGMYLLYNTLRKGGPEWEPVTEERFLVKLNAAQFA